MKKFPVMIDLLVPARKKFKQQSYVISMLFLRTQSSTCLERGKIYLSVGNNTLFNHQTVIFLSN